MDPYRNYGHMEDFDSVQGDVESRGATIGASTVRYSASTDMDAMAGIRRGQMNARLEERKQSTVKLSPDELMDRILNGGGDGEDCFSVNTGRVMDEQTFDGSTIATGHFYKGGYEVGPRRSSRPFPTPDRTQGSDSSEAGGASPANLKPAPKKKSCLTSTKCWLVVALLVAMGVITAGVLWFVLIYMPGQSDESPHAANLQENLPCCTGYNQENWSGSQVCTEAGQCCRVCPAAADLDGDAKVDTTPQEETAPGWEVGNNQEDADVIMQEQVEEENPKEDEADQFLPETTTSAPTPLPTPVPTTAGPTTPGPSTAVPVAPSPTPRPTSGETTVVVADTPSPTDPPTPTPAPTTSVPEPTPSPTPEATTANTDPPSPAPSSSLPTQSPTAAPTTDIPATVATPAPTEAPTEQLLPVEALPNNTTGTTSDTNNNDI